MRALHVLRPDAPTRRAGDVVHAACCASALRALDVEVETTTGRAPDAEGFDVAHLFGVVDPEASRAQLRALREQGVAIVLSPLWHPDDAFRALSPLLERALAGSDGAVAPALLGVRLEGAPPPAAAEALAPVRALVAEADVVIACGEVEAYVLGERLRLPRLTTVVAPVGVDDDAFGEERPPARRGVLALAPIAPRKNQAALLYALRDVDVEVTLAGDAEDDGYLALCRRWATPRTRFVARPPKDDALRLMARAAVHALPSWHGRPGIAPLEAAATGARLVVGDRGAEREYFGADVEYADPLDPEAIRDAVVRALERGPRDRGDGLERRLGARTWQRNAEATLEAYARALAGRA